MALIQIDNLRKSFGKVSVLNGVSLELDAGEQYVIQGASGSGKSTLLYLLGGLDRATGGEIRVDNKVLADMNDQKLADYRNHYVGLVFQFHFLLPSMNCLKNILLPAQIGQASMREVEERVRPLAEALGVTHCLEKFPFELSGGEQQRVNIIRALSMRPQLLLCDEPTGNLDSENSQNVSKLLRDLAHEFGSTLVVVTHDGEVASCFSKRFVMQDGKLLT
ncbi:MAG: ABC transporter ATP-binding protein [Halobacteriovoraceae bacterium]|jgi:lipoprotein-releasing system ATP-binding protein|nr:ABC transporter ATP-binding protein [Halobacteriovoraceae bacterium]